MISLFFALFFFTGATAILGLAAYHDWRELKIPNHLSLALIGLFALGAIMPHGIFNGVGFVSGLIGGLIVFVFLMVLYAGGAMGAGDTKLAGAAALLVGVRHLDVFLTMMAFSGGLLALYALFARKYPAKLIPASLAGQGWLSQLKDGHSKLPYGLAIACGGIASLAVKWLVPAFS